MKTKTKIMAIKLVVSLSYCTFAYSTRNSINNDQLFTNRDQQKTLAYNPQRLIQTKQKLIIKKDLDKRSMCSLNHKKSHNSESTVALSYKADKTAYDNKNRLINKYNFTS